MGAILAAPLPNLCYAAPVLKALPAPRRACAHAICSALPLALESQGLPQRPPAHLLPPLRAVSLRGQSLWARFWAHLLWAAVKSFRQVRSPLTAAWCSGKAPSSVSSVAAWPSCSNHSTSAGCPNRAARCSGETPEASWSYQGTSKTLNLCRPPHSLAGARPAWPERAA